MEFGTQLIQSGIVCCEVPSVVESTSYNYLINPMANDFAKIQWEVYSLKLDPRIVR